MLKVSFILPAYKRAFLHDAIASILAQSYPDFELVVVDDASPEKLAEVVQSFHDERLTYYRNDENLGGKNLVQAWNHAMEYARGQWCILASDDDLYHPDFLREMILLTEKYPSVNLVHCRNCDIDDQGKLLRIGKPRAEYETGIQMMYNSVVMRVEHRMADLMFRRSAFEEMHGFVSFPLAWYSDSATAIALSWKNGVACSDKILFSFRHSAVNISSQVTDVVEKIEAGLQFLSWGNQYIDRAVPQCDNDRLMLPLLREGITQDVYRVIHLYLMQCGIISLVKALKKLSGEERHKALYKRERKRSLSRIWKYLFKWS